MAQLSTQDIAKYAYQAGFRGMDLVYAVAIAIRESAGNPQAYNPEVAAGTKKGSGSRGLWQIYGQAHPEFNNDSLYDPLKNAQAAFKVYQEVGNKFTPWSTWNNGSAKSLALTLGDIKESAIAGLSTTAGSVAGSVASGGASAIGEAANSVLDNLGGRLLGKNAEGKPREMADAIAYLSGSVLILLGLIFLFVKSGAGETTVKIAGKVAKAAI
jgi:lysozyme-like protein